MGDQPEQTPAQIAVNIKWPPNTYLDALPVNAFVLNDVGENLCLAFGFVPPPPGIEKLAQAEDFTIQAERISAIFIPKSMTLQLVRELRNYIHNNPQAFAGQRVDDEDDISTGR